MSDNTRYRIFPKDAASEPIPQVDSIPLDDREKEDIKGLGGGAGFILTVVAFGVSVWLGMSEGLEAFSAMLVAFIAAVLVCLLVSTVVRGSKISEKEREKAKRTKQGIEYTNKRAISTVEGEAQALTSQLIRTYESSSTLASELPQHLDSAVDWVRHAEREFKDNAFGPFWDAVENAAQHLASFDHKAKQVSRLADEYYRGLNGRSHTFPSFPLNNANLPSPSSAVNELRRVVRMGQTNFQFANIWEHRRTREVMIGGFRTLGEAVNNLGSTVENSLFGLQQSVSSDMAKLVQEEIKTRASLDKRMLEQNRMLDNIQHHRKPR